MSLLILAAVAAWVGRYYLVQGWGLLQVYGRARSVDRWLAGDRLSEDERALLLNVQDIRRFAREEIGLSDHRNYTTYARVDRSYLADVVHAAPPDSLRPHLFRYPFFGRMPYKGFFSRTRAEAEARRLEQQGLEVLVRPVRGFSTLGILRDPLFSYMTGYELYDLADLIIHEQVHATVWLDDHYAFNENLAVFVGRRGALEYLVAQEGPPNDAAVQLARDVWHDRRAFRIALHELYRRWEAIYQQDIPLPEMLQQREQAWQEFGAEWRARYSQRFRTDRFYDFPNRTMDNAYLSLQIGYTSLQDEFEQIYELLGGDLRLLMQAAAAVQDTGAPDFDPMQQLWQVAHRLATR